MKSIEVHFACEGCGLRDQVITELPFPLHLQAKIWLVVAQKYHHDIESSRLTLPLIALGVFSCRTYFQMNWTMKEHCIFLTCFCGAFPLCLIPFRLTKCEKVSFGLKH